MDRRVSFVQTGGGVQATLFDPNRDIPILLYDGMGGDATLDGVFHDIVNASVKQANLLTAAGAPTSSLAAARWFDVVAFDGQVTRFEVVTTANSTTANGGTKSGLLTQWAMDEGAGTSVSDISGLSTASGHTGSFLPSPSFVAGHTGQTGDYALNFNGTNQAIALGNPADLNFTGQITMSAWIQPTNTTGWHTILGHGYTTSPQAQTSMEIYNGNLLVGAWPGTRPAQVALPANAGSTWTHVVATYDGTNWNVFVNGVLKASAADATGARQVAANWRIGSGTYPGDMRFFQGGIDDVRIYNRALTPTEVTALTAGTDPTSGAPLAQWGMNEGTGATVADATGSAAHLGKLAPSQPTWVAGHTGLPGDNALHFDGNGVVPIANPADLNVSGKITMTAWIKPEASSSTYQSILSHGFSNSPNAYDFLFLESNNAAYGGSWNGATNYAGAYLPANSQNGNTWIHVAGEYDGNNWRLYLNGVLSGVAQTGTGALPVNANWVLGGSSVSQDPRNFTGTIDDVRIYNRALSDSEIYNLGSNQKSYGGRLVSVTDLKSHGYGVTYKYNPATSTQDAAATQSDPDLLWQMAASTDSLNNQVTYTYAPTEVAGSYVISQANFSNGQSATYTYGDGLHLTQVNHSDGSVSTFTYGVDSQTQNTTVAIHDSTADVGHQNKTAYLTNQITVGVSNNFAAPTVGTANIWNQSALVARQITNGAGEISYLCFHDTLGAGAANANIKTIYEGGNRIKLLNGEWFAQFYQAGAKLVVTNGVPTIQGTLEPVFAQNSYAGGERPGQLGNYPGTTDATGLTVTYTYDGQSFPTKKTYGDGTTELWAYDVNHNVTSHTDRAGRTTVSTYDGYNNLLARTVGTGADAGTTTYAYYPAGDPNQFLLKTETDANGNATDYTYDANHHVLTKTLPADVAGGTRPVYTYAYDSAGRLSQSTDPVGRYVIYTYDILDRVINKNYCGVSHEQTVYGTGDLANYVVAQSERDNNWTLFQYDSTGRVIKTIGGVSDQTVTSGHSTQTITTGITDPTQLATIQGLATSYTPDTAFNIVTTNVYLPGSNNVAYTDRNGEQTAYQYDYKNRVIVTTVYTGSDANGNPRGLTTATTYLNNSVFCTTDPYGRNTYYNYRTSDYATIRKVTETVPGAVATTLGSAPTAFSQIAGLTRITTANAPYTIEDYTLDVSGLQTAVMDANGNTSQITYDTRGRATIQQVAVGTPVAAQSQTIYDANSNVIEQRSPRYFDAADASGYNKAKTVMTYSGRNLLLAQTQAPGMTEAGTTTMTYYLDGKQATTTLPNGNVAGATQAQKDAQTTLRMERPLCGWALGTVDQAGNGTITNTSVGGDVIHTIQVKDLKSLTTTLPNGLVVPNFLNEVDMDVPDANTITESTTKYDSRHRPIASTVWSGPLAAVNRADVPVYFSGAVQGGAQAQSAVPSGVTGQTTLYYYSEDLTTPTLHHAFGPDLNIQPVLQKLIDAGNSPLLANGSNASARATISPTGEVTVQIMDGAGRSVISAKLDTTAP